MSRPRKPPDAVRLPSPRARCVLHYQIVVNWADGGVCGYCYQQAKRSCDTCRCGHEGVLPPVRPSTLLAGAVAEGEAEADDAS